MEYIKVYVAVTVLIDEQGLITPLSVIYEGRELIVDKIIDIRTAPPKHVGGLITRRYDCKICGKVRPLYVETTGRWFVEAYERACYPQ